MASFPTLASGSIARYPLDCGIISRTQILEFVDGSEQALLDGRASQKFTLRFTQVRTADMLAIRTFWTNAKGAFDQTWDITIGSETITNCFFESDMFTANEASEGLWTFDLDVATRA